MPVAKRKRNPVKAAAELTEAFLGRPAQSETEYVEEYKEHSVLSDLAPVTRLFLSEDGDRFDSDRKPEDCTEIRFRGVRLAYTEGETQQIYFVGGDQEIDLRKFPEADRRKEDIPLLPVAFIEYETAKFHLGREDKKVGPYIHAFNEEDKGKLPTLRYDPVNCKAYLSGGNYYIEIDMDGKYSAGIRN